MEFAFSFVVFMVRTQAEYSGLLIVAGCNLYSNKMYFQTGGIMGGRFSQNHRLTNGNGACRESIRRSEFGETITLMKFSLVPEPICSGD